MQPTRKLLLCVPILVLLVTLLWSVFRRPGTEEIALRTLRALERQDAKTLVHLTSPQERKRLNLTAETVETWLRQTLWRNGPPGPLKIVQTNVVRPNVVQYRVATNEQSSQGEAFFLIVTTYQLEGEPFHVALGELLWNVCPLHSSRPRGPKSLSRLYREMARQTGIRGTFDGIDHWQILF